MFSLFAAAPSFLFPQGLIEKLSRKGVPAVGTVQPVTGLPLQKLIVHPAPAAGAGAVVIVKKTENHPYNNADSNENIDPSSPGKEQR